MAKSKRDRALARARAQASAKHEARQAKALAKLRDSGPDEGGRYGINPYAVRGRVVEIAPKELRDNPNSTQYPKRIMPALDWYKAHGHIEPAEHRAGAKLLDTWGERRNPAKMTAGYDPVVVQSSPNADGRMIQHIDAGAGYTRLMKAVPYRCRGVVEAVVIEGRTAAEWARGRGIGCRDSKAHGLMRLRAGLQGLVKHLRY